MKHCTHCGAEMERPTKVSHKQWEKQCYCSKTCSNLASAGKRRIHDHAPVFVMHPLMVQILDRGVMV